MNLKKVSSCLQYKMQLQNVSLQHADAPSSRYWAVSVVISNSHVDCWLLYICPKLWAGQHNISSCESPGSCSTWGKSSVKHYLLNLWMCMKRSWQVAASFPIMPPSLSRGHKNGERQPKKKKQNWGHLQLLNVHMKICWKHYFPLLFVLCNQWLLNTLEHGTFTELLTVCLYYVNSCAHYSSFARRMWRDFQFL